MKRISLDTETTGLDLRHGAKPFLVTTCDERGVNTFWEWDVDPLTREPEVVYEDLEEIQKTINWADEIVLQNAKFDYTALQAVFLGKLRWDWGKVRDTLLAGHLLASNQPHNLTDMALVYLNVNIEPYEVSLKKAVEAARRFAKSKCSGRVLSKMSDGSPIKTPTWHIAKAGLPEMPSVKGSAAKCDYWLPRAWAKEQGYPEDDPWWTLCSEYANCDSSTTIFLYKRQRELLKKRGLWKIYLERLKVLPVACAVEEKGITISRQRLGKLQKDYREESRRAGKVCISIAKTMGHDLTLPKSGNNKSLGDFVFGKLGLEPQKRSKKTGAPSLDKATLEHWEATLPRRSKALAFVKALKGKRRRDTALAYMEGYERFWLPLRTSPKRVFVLPGWYVLHPSLNPTGTDTLRWSSSNPNGQNISKQEGFNLRYCFGPGPGREWWSMDAKNIELRIPAYEAGERSMIDLFERESDPPYYGSYHLLVFDILHPEKFAKHGVRCKEVYESTWYGWVKNGNFAVLNGAVEESGTADRAYHVKGAQRRIKSKLRGVTRLGERIAADAGRVGYVETMPDKTVDPIRGYPLLCGLTPYGRVIQTVPFSYHVQGTACWWMMKAMTRCYEYLQTQRDCYMVMQVHDELVFDLPKGDGGRGDPRKNVNLPVIMKIKELMEKGGDDIGVPTPVSVTYHERSLDAGIGVV